MAVLQPSPFAALLKRYRLSAGLTQEELAEGARLSVRGISDLERGVNLSPRSATVKQLADALELSPQYRAKLVAAARGFHPPSQPLAEPESRVQPHLHGLPPAPLVGRGVELRALDRHLAGDGPPLLLFAGEPGIGKTRLLQEAVERGSETGFIVLRGGSQRRSGQEPYAPLVETLSGYVSRQSPGHLRAALQGCPWLVRLLPELLDVVRAPLPLGTLDPGQERRLVFSAVVRFLQNVSGPAGVLLLLDDLHWAGTDALDLLATLIRSAPGVPLRVIGAYRDTEIGAEDDLAAMLADMARADLAIHRSLGPLPSEEATELLGRLVAGVERAGTNVEEQILQRAGGVPFFLVSYAQGLRVGSLDLSARQDIPWTTAQSIRQRVASLPDDARRVLNAAAVAGRVFPRALVVAVAGREEAAVVVGLDTACKARLLEAQPGHTYRFTHDLVREVIEADLGAAQRTLLHRRIGRAREQVPDQQRGQHAAELAWHFLEGDEPGRALPYTILAGDQAEEVYAHDEAERHYRTALELARQLGDTSRQAGVLEKLGLVLYRTSRLTESREASQKAAEM